MGNAALFTAGPWRWFGNTQNHHLYLATERRGRVYVMDFVRWGMGSAQPRFQPAATHLMTKAADLVTYEVEYRRDITGIDHPDAHLIAASPDLYTALEALLHVCTSSPGAGATVDAVIHARAALAKARGER